MPEVAGRVDPLEELDPRRAKQFSDVGARVLPVDQRPLAETYPTGCYMVAPEVEDKVRRKLLSCNAAVLTSKAF